MFCTLGHSSDENMLFSYSTQQKMIRMTFFYLQQLLQKIHLTECFSQRNPEQPLH